MGQGTNNAGSTIGSLLGTGLGALGFLVPGLGPITMGLGASLGSGLGSLFDQPAQPEAPYMMNQDQVNAWQNQLQSMLAGNQQLDMNNYNQMTQWLGQGQGYMGRSSALLDQMANFKSGVQYDPNASIRQFLSMAPSMQQVARESIGSGSAEGDLATMQAQALRDVAAQFGPDAGNSGAFQSQAITAMAQPRYQAAMARQQLEAGLTGNLLGGLQSQLGANYINEANVGLQREQMGLNALGQAAQGYSGLTQQAMSGAGIFGNLYGQQLQNQQSRENMLMGLMGALNEPVWYTPPTVNGGGGGIGSGDILSILNLLRQGGAFNTPPNAYTPPAVNMTNTPSLAFNPNAWAYADN